MSAKLRKVEGGQVTFWCPACKEPHAIVVGNGRWRLIEDADGITVEPSIKVTSGHFCPDFDSKVDTCWCSYYRDHPEESKPEDRFNCGVCHSFIRKGRIQFEGDSTHVLAGQTVELPDWPK